MLKRSFIMIHSQWQRKQFFKPFQTGET